MVSIGSTRVSHITVVPEPIYYPSIQARCLCIVCFFPFPPPRHRRRINNTNKKAAIRQDRNTWWCDVTDKTPNHSSSVKLKAVHSLKSSLKGVSTFKSKSMTPRTLGSLVGTLKVGWKLKMAPECEKESEWCGCPDWWKANWLISSYFHW